MINYYYYSLNVYKIFFEAKRYRKSNNLSSNRLSKKQKFKKIYTFLNRFATNKSSNEELVHICIPTECPQRIVKYLCSFKVQKTKGVIFYVRYALSRQQN